MSRVRRAVSVLGGQEGVALVSLLVIVAALTVLSMGLILFSSTEVRIANNQRYHASALYVTESGIEEMKSRMELNPGSMVTVNGATFDASIRDSPVAPNPNWRTEMYLSTPGGLPAPSGTEVIVPTVQSSANWLTYGDAANGLAPIVVEHKWVDRNGDGVRSANELVRYDAGQFPPENFDKGHLIEVITASGMVNGSQRMIVTEVTHLPLVVNVTAAISCDNGVDLTGNMSGCGHNHDMTTPTGTKIPACRNFEQCSNRTQDAVAGCLIAVMTTGDDAETGGSSDLDGFPAWGDTSSANIFYNVEEYLGITVSQWSQVRDDADYTSANDAAVMHGTVVVDGDATGSETFNGTSGTGLIYVDGDMDISGNFVWRGLIYVEGDCTITGTAWILGAMVVRGETTEGAFAAGNSTILYSQDAILTFVGQQLDYTTLSWREL